MTAISAIVAGALALTPAAHGATPPLWTAGGTTLRLQIERDGGYSVLRQGVSWLTGAATALHCNGKWYSSRPVAGQERLTLVDTKTGLGKDVLGAYTLETLRWDADGTPFVTSFRVYRARPAIVFAQSFPHGASGTAVASATDAPRSDGSGRGEENRGAPTHRGYDGSSHDRRPRAVPGGPMDAYLSKPSQPQELCDLLDRILGAERSDKIKEE